MTPNIIRSRQSIRLKGYDYSRVGCYFITLCTQNRVCLFGQIKNSKLILNTTGQMIDFQWTDLKNKYPTIVLDSHIVMPNHLHGIITVGAPLKSPDTIGSIIGRFKSITTYTHIQQIRAAQAHPFNRKLWQRNYYEHIIRDADELRRIRKYILENPAHWAFNKT